MSVFKVEIKDGSGKAKRSGSAVIAFDCEYETVEDIYKALRDHSIVFGHRIWFKWKEARHINDEEVELSSEAVVLKRTEQVLGVDMILGIQPSGMVLIEGSGK